MFNLHFSSSAFFTLVKGADYHTFRLSRKIFIQNLNSMLRKGLVLVVEIINSTWRSVRQTQVGLASSFH